MGSGIGFVVFPGTLIWVRGLPDFGRFHGSYLRDLETGEGPCRNKQLEQLKGDSSSLRHDLPCTRGEGLNGPKRR